MVTTPDSTAVPTAPTPVAATGTTTELNDSVESRVAGITSKNSPLMKAAKTRGLQQANKRGLLNSSMAVGAAQRSMLDAAVPIASADAETSARKNLIAREFDERGDLSAQEFTQQQSLQATDIASKERIANWNIDSHDREKAASLVAAFESSYGEQFRTIAQNEKLPADVRENYLTHIASMRDSNLNLVEQMYGIDLTWTTPGVA